MPEIVNTEEWLKLKTLEQKQRPLLNLTNTHEALQQLRGEIEDFAAAMKIVDPFFECSIYHFLQSIGNIMSDINWVLEEHVWFDPEKSNAP